MSRILLVCVFLLYTFPSYSWGFFAHKKINYYAVFLLPPEMMVLFKPQIDFLSEHAVDPDKRRYAIAEEGARHFIDLDHYGHFPFDSLPPKWKDAVARYSEDTLNTYGIVPWWIQTMLARLTLAFKEKDVTKVLKYAAEIGHYMADAHVPLHANSNHNGQLTGQQGIHAFWESRIPELLSEKNETNGWDFFIGKAIFIKDPLTFTWKKILESAAAADTVLRCEKWLSAHFPMNQRYTYEERNGITVRQYSPDYCKAYNKLLNGMIERRMRQAVFAVASLWYTAWINAGQPNLATLSPWEIPASEAAEFEKLNAAWKTGHLIGREE